MGFRTTVILANDHAHDWSKDPQLGEYIARSMNYANRAEDRDYAANLPNGYGRVVECTHADTQTLAVIDSYNMRGLAFSNWSPAQTKDEVAERLLREAADRLGYRLVKKSVRQA